MKQNRFILFSLALHAAILLVLLVQHRESAEKPPEAVMLDLSVPQSPSRPALPLGAPGKSTGAASASRKQSAFIPDFSALAPIHKNDVLRAVHPGEFSSAAPAPDALSPYAASDDIFASAPAANTGALAWVYRKAQFTIGYPQAFIHHNITGQAQARLVFDSSGKLRSDQLHVQSDSPYLRVYVYRILESTFGRENIPANLVRWKDSLEVFCFVKFSFSESDTAVTVASGNPIVGNKLFFARKTFKSLVVEKLKWDLGPLHGVLPVPVVGLDVLWFARKADELKHPLRAQAEADDLAPYRKDPLFYD